MKKLISIGAVLVAVTVALLYVPRAFETAQTISVLPPVVPASTTQSIVSIPTSATSVATATAAANATFIIGDTTYPVAVSANETVIDTMDALMAAGTITFTGRDYPGLGFFVDSINGEKNANGKYWILYMNDVSAPAGVSATTIRAGDIVEWQYEQGY